MNPWVLARKAQVRAIPPATWVLVLGLGAGCRVEEIETPSVVLGDVEVRGLSGGMADLMLEIKVENKNKFEVTLVGINGGLELDGVDVGQVVWSGEHSCPKNKESSFHIPAQVPVGESRHSFMSLIDGNQPVQRALHGEVTFARGVIRKTYPLAVKEVSEASGSGAPATGMEQGQPQSR